MEPLGNLLQFRGSLLAQSNHGHFDSLTARRFEHQEGKAAVPSDQTPFSGKGCGCWEHVSKKKLLLGYTAIGRLDEAHQFGDIHGAVEREPHLFEGLGGIELRVQEKAIGALDGPDSFGSEAAALQADAIDPVTTRLAFGDDHAEWRDILGNHGRGAYIGKAADAAKLMDRRKGANGGVVLDRDVAGQRGAIGKNRMAAYNTIVGHMSLGHEQIVAADAR